MNTITNNVSNIEEDDDYGFFCEFEQTISSDNMEYTNQRNYKIDKNILKKLNNKYKYTILNQNFLPISMLKKIPTYYTFKNRSPKSSKVMPILDANYIIEKNLQEDMHNNNIKENTKKNRLLINSVLIVSFCVSLLLLFL
jgi:hypothetical protein